MNSPIISLPIKRPFSDSVSDLEGTYACYLTDTVLVVRTFTMGFQLSVPLLCFAVLAVMQSGGQAKKETRMFSKFQQMLEITKQKVGAIGDKQRRDMETLNSGLNSRIEERVKHLFRKWAGMPKIRKYNTFG